MKKNSYLEDFEGMIIRNDYLKRSHFDEAYYNDLKHLAKITAAEMFFKYDTFYRRISYHQDDVEQICNCYLVSYLSLYSIKNDEKFFYKVMEKYQKMKGRLPDEVEMKREDRNRAIQFMRQQCQKSVVVVNRKSRNIIMGKDKIHFFAFTENSIEVSDLSVLVKSWEKLNYRKITLKEYKMLQKKHGKRQEVLDDFGYKVVLVQILAEGEGDYGETDYTPDNRYAPETVLCKIEDDKEMAYFDSEFKKDKNKIIKLKSFIEAHKRDKSYKDEVKAANAILKEIVI